MRYTTMLQKYRASRAEVRRIVPKGRGLGIVNWPSFSEGNQGSTCVPYLDNDHHAHTKERVERVDYSNGYHALSLYSHISDQKQSTD